MLERPVALDDSQYRSEAAFSRAFKRVVGVVRRGRAAEISAPAS